MTTRNFLIKQRFAAMVNRYEIWSVDAHWQPTTMLGFAQQKRMKMREEVVFYTDDSKNTVLFTFKARNVLDIRSVVDVYDGAGQAIGEFRKDFAASLLNSTWLIDQAGQPQVKGQEKSAVYAIIRRFTDFGFIPYDFVFSVGERPVMEIVRKWGLRDTYQVTVTAEEYDTRLLQAVAVGLDALQNR
ncbi:hypothetical protein [Demequina sp.]|uniref:hypothetical protein n=1 Tax=Demequina sp. TaxID=2050685 RepID=UPI0025C65A43|nr:hypothetical protein [Demequina sp.]